MRAFINKTDRIDSSSSLPKYRQVINTIMMDIQQELFKPGQRIPSINETSEEYYLSRDTVEKAYRELRQRGIISSVPGKGYYVNPSVGIKKMRVLVLFDTLCKGRQNIYNALRQTLGKQAVCTFYVHDQESKIFANLILDNLGNYDHYVLMPHVNDVTTAIKAIKKIPRNKLIILDKKLARLGGSFGTVFQDFSMDIFSALNSAKPLMAKYQQLNLIAQSDKDFHQDIFKGVKRFCHDLGIPLKIMPRICEEFLKKQHAYLILEDEELIRLVKVAQEKKWEIGKDLGVISYQDTPIKEVLEGGITVVGTDHQQMGISTANMILNKSSERIHNPFKLIQRKSL